MNPTVHLFPRIKCHYSHFTDKEYKTQQKYMDAKKYKPDDNNNSSTTVTYVLCV